MVWKRFGFVCSVRVQGLPIAKACRIYGISRTTGYEWLNRFDISPERLIKDHSRRPHHTPNATPDVVSQKILELKDDFGWGAEKIKTSMSALSLPSPSVTTIQRILSRNGRNRYCPWPLPKDSCQLKFPGMVTDTQVRRLMKLRKLKKSLAVAAAGMDEKTARKYLKSGKLPSQLHKSRHWRTHPDAFAPVWPEVEKILEGSLTVQAKTLFDHLCGKYKGGFQKGQLRTLQRRVKRWREKGSGPPINPGALESVAKLMIERRLEQVLHINRRIRQDVPPLLDIIASGQPRERKRAAVILLLGLGEPKQRVVEKLKSSRQTVAKYWKEYQEKGLDMISNQYYGRSPKSKDKNIQDALFQLLHSPPSSYGINRTTWRMKDLRMVLRKQGTPVSLALIRQIIRGAGYKWRRARVVLTSRDPNYHEKLDHIRSILSNLRSDERFFSIDEFGPFAIKMRPGRLLVPPGEYPTVPQYQKSKGYLIVTAALELSTNQITHLYSKKKNTLEMIYLMELLIHRYANCRKLYFSWDSASWHGSKKLNRWVKEVNSDQFRTRDRTPLVELVPLPAGAQFLNVIESVFSGLARAVVHNSNYQSIEQARAAIDRYFQERNEYFQKHPKRAGKKIWGKERVPCSFSETQNCKDPRYR